MRFGDHMMICMALAALHCIVWSTWSLSVLLSSRKQGVVPLSAAALCLLCQVWFAAGSLLEVLDFPPLLIHFDAHALWHAATVPLGFLWYMFWNADATECLSMTITTVQCPPDTADVKFVTDSDTEREKRE